MKGYIEVWYEGELIQHWISNKGYCYKRDSDCKVKRVSNNEYRVAYETHYNL